MKRIAAVVVLGLMAGVSMTEGPHPSVRVGESGRHVELGGWLLGYGGVR